jgi:hypothetical protein
MENLMDYVSYFILGLTTFTMLSSIVLRFYFGFLNLRSLGLERAGYSEEGKDFFD